MESNSKGDRKLFINIDEQTTHSSDLSTPLLMNSCADNSDESLFFDCVTPEELDNRTAAEDCYESNEQSIQSLVNESIEGSDEVSSLEDESIWFESIATEDSLTANALNANMEQTISYREKRFNNLMDLLDVCLQKAAVVRKRRLSEESLEMIDSSNPIKKLKNGLTSRQLLTEINSESDNSLIDNEMRSEKKSIDIKSDNKMVVHNKDNKTNGIHAISTRSGGIPYISFLENRYYKGVVMDSRQPYLISGTIMRDYQLEGLDWLRILHSNNMNGILADEMGLGKTIQAISLFAHLIETNETDPYLGPFLVIAPLSTLHNWKKELERFAPLIPSLVFHGNLQKRKVLYKEFNKVFNILAFGKSRKCYPVVITSYEVFKQSISSMRKHKWMYVVIDEGHKIKNINAQLSRLLRTIHSTNRLILTGTPLQNNLAELWALLNYVSPDIFNNWEIFEDLLEMNSSNEQIIQKEMEMKIISSIHKILSPFMLRRTKTEVGLSLPPKKEVLVYAPSTPTQQALYETAINLVKNSKTKINYFTVDCDLSEGRKPRKSVKNTDYTQYYKGFDEWLDDLEEDSFKSLIAQQSLMELPKELISGDCDEYVSFGRFTKNNIMMQMRKITNHPFLVRWPLERRTRRVLVDEDIIKTSGKMRALDELLSQLFVRKHRVILFSQMTKLLDILEEYCDYRKYSFVRFDGSTHLEDRQRYIEEFNTNDNIFIFLVSTRAGGLGINLVGADTAIIYDSDWNPQMDLQAQDRCHRIEQSKPVMVYRLITAHTIDEKMLRTANNKRKLDKMIIQKGQYFRSTEHQNKKPISMQELLNILESTDFKAIYKYSSDKLGSKSLYSDEDLKKMLDRSGVDEHNQSLIEIGAQFNA